MKKISFAKWLLYGLQLFLLFSGSSLSGQSYSYLPTIKEGNRWKFNANIGMGGVITVDYHLHGDSVIAGKSYLKVINVNDVFVGTLLREDTLAKKIYAINPNSAPQEFLQYDFNLNLGDTIQGSVVAEVDTAFLYGRYRRVIKFNSPNYCYCDLIEGVGSSFIGVWAPTCAPMGVWFFSEGMVSSSNEDEKQPGLFSIFPNPGSDYFNVQIKDNSGAAYHYFLYDSYGGLQQTGSLNAENLNKINVHSLTSGLYFIKILDEQSRQKGVFNVLVE